MNRVHALLHKLGTNNERRNVVRAAGLARSFLDGFESTHDPYDMVTNGESWLLDRLGPDLLNVVLDVGANIGEWTTIALDAGAAAVHSFEIAPATSARLRDRFETEQRVNVADYGLDDSPGLIPMTFYPNDSVLSSTMLEHRWPLEFEEIKVRVDTGDRYLAENSIDYVDLLKLDVEGAESRVLRGFQKAFESASIGAIQFEYGISAAATKFLIIDFYNWFTEHGFELGPLTERGVDFTDYSMLLERFEHVNWVAVHTSRPEVRQRLAVSQSGR